MPKAVNMSMDRWLSFLRSQMGSIRQGLDKVVEGVKNEEKIIPNIIKKNCDARKQ